MKLKPLALVVAVLALAAGLVYWRGNAPVADPSADPRVGQPLVAADILGRIRGLRVVSGGQTVTLAADKDGQHWNVPDYYALPADFGKLVTLVESLRSAKVTRFVTALPEKIDRLGFTGDLVELRDADAKPLLSLHLGKNAESGGRFVRLGDEKKAYLVELDAWLDAVAKNWARSQLLDLKAENVAALEFRFADGSTLAAKRNADATAWTADGLPEGKELKAASVDSLVAQLASLRLTETSEPTAPDAVAAREHAQTVVVTLKDGTSYTVALGRRPAPPTPPAAANEEGRMQKEEAAPVKSGAISATTPPVTIGPDGKVQVVTLPPTANEEVRTQNAEVAAPETIPAPTESGATPAPASAKPPATPAPQPGPVFAFITANREADPINALMQKRAFQIGEWILNTLPTTRDALLQDTPASPPAPAASAPAPAPATPPPS